ncbi:MAG: M48 family metallopeptidase [Rhodospirillales bacterium]|nr:M48 family metallopeptidase [Rhodospirillales bacterium]
MRRFVFLLVLLCSVAGCATSPTGRSQLMVVSESQAIAASKQAYAQEVKPYASKGRLDSNPAMTNRVRQITSRLIAEAVLMRPETEAWEWQVVVLDDPDAINAWAMAGGKMAVYSGLIQQVQPTDDELAQVIGHEIGHALAAHTAEKMSVAMMTQLGVTAVGAATNSPAAMSAGAAAAALAITLPNSRTAEEEADRIGIELAAKAGYDPRAAVSLWQKMDKATAGGKPPQFLSTHPSSENRAARLERLVPQMQVYYERAKQAQPASPPAPSR